MAIAHGIAKEHAHDEQSKWSVIDPSGSTSIDRMLSHEPQCRGKVEGWLSLEYNRGDTLQLRYAQVRSGAADPVGRGLRYHSVDGNPSRYRSSRRLEFWNQNGAPFTIPNMEIHNRQSHRKRMKAHVLVPHQSTAYSKSLLTSSSLAIGKSPQVSLLSSIVCNLSSNV